MKLDGADTRHPNADVQPPSGDTQRAASSSRARLIVHQVAKNRGSAVAFGVIIVFFLGAIFAAQVAPYDPRAQNATAILKPPSTQHLLGTDRLGRDILSRVLYGSRVSLVVSLLSVTAALTVGVTIGLISGYFGGHVDSLLQRLTDIMMALPTLIFAIAIVAALGPTLIGIVLAISIASVPTYVRLTRSIVLSLRERDFVAAAHALGAAPLRVMFRHLLPNSLGPLVVQSTLGLGSAILLEAGLSFLGLGIQPPTPSWGRMVAEGRDFLYSGPHLITIPGLFIMVTVLSFNLLGDGLRDALDPRFHAR